MQHFDDLDHYTESDFDDYTYRSPRSKKPYYEEETKQFYFTYEDYHGYDQELFTTIDCVWKVTPGTFYYDAPSDLDYYGYSELTAWVVVSVVDSQGDEVNPEEVLTEKQLQDYNATMLNFIEE